MKVRARRREGYLHDVEIEGGAHRLRVDEPEAAGGADAGPSPTRLVAAGLASCIAITVEMYAERKGWDIGEVEAEVEVEYEDHVPVSFAAALHLTGDLSEEQRERLLAIARRCPVHRVLAEQTRVAVSGQPEAL